MRILVVEDEAGVAGFVKQGLTEAGYVVNVARDGSEGLEYALAFEYDLIVLDIMLPKMRRVTNFIVAWTRQVNLQIHFHAARALCQNQNPVRQKQ